MHNSQKSLMYILFVKKHNLSIHATRKCDTAEDVTLIFPKYVKNRQVAFLCG